jgi:uncharacterized SAM-binding protein YcdF (DUF218 family)
MSNTIQQYDVIIILGAAQKKDGSPGPAMERRVHHGVDCLNEGMAPYILMAGGRTKTPIPESQTMTELALQHGVGQQAVVQESNSMRTIENAIECRRIMQERNWIRALLVTDSFHMPRALRSFQALGVDVTPEPNAVPISLSSVLSYSREWIARLAYIRINRRYKANSQ